MSAYEIVFIWLLYYIHICVLTTIFLVSICCVAYGRLQFVNIWWELRWNDNHISGFFPIRRSKLFFSIWHWFLKDLWLLLKLLLILLFCVATHRWNLVIQWFFLFARLNAHLNLRHRVLLTELRRVSRLAQLIFITSTSTRFIVKTLSCTLPLLLTHYFGTMASCFLREVVVGFSWKLHFIIRVVYRTPSTWIWNVSRSEFIRSGSVALLTIWYSWRTLSLQLLCSICRDWLNLMLQLLLLMLTTHLIVVRLLNRWNVV